jgi:pyruvate-formate lyase-activating enzyme
MPCLLFANSKGEIMEYEGLEMAGRSGTTYVRPQLEDLIPLPQGSELFTLSGRLPIGFEAESGEPALLEVDPYGGHSRIQAVAAFMAPAHTATHWAAFQKEGANSPTLPLFAYTAAGWYDGRIWVAGFRSDPDTRQDCSGFHQPTIDRRTNRRLKHHPDNRLIQHLGKCSLTYGCPAARNYFLDRHEAPLPCSPVCNADCVGCISLQQSGCCASSQERIKFVPSVEELSEVALGHIERVTGAVVSFGQGCEGEPLLQADTMVRAVRAFRSHTTRGTINCNTNGSLPGAVARLAEAGLDSIRISLNSAQPELHHRYYRPRGFTFDDVKQSIQTMKQQHRFVSLNYFILPGLTDDPAEFAALCQLIDELGPDLIQLRNLNMDPDLYLESLNFKPSGQPLGIRSWLARLKARFPALGFGYFNPSLN